MSEEIRNEQAHRIGESPGNTGPIMKPQLDQAISANQTRSEFSEQYVKPVVAELIGTFGFVFIGAGSIITNTLTHGAVGLVGIALATGLALAIMITIFAATSGGHINPAVTVGFLVTRRIAPLLGLLYIVAQLVGATLAGLLLRVMYPQALWQAALLGTPNLAPGVSFGLGVLIEAVLTFFLLLAVFGTAVDPRAPKIGGFGIGLTVLVDILLWHRPHRISGYSRGRTTDGCIDESRTHLRPSTGWRLLAERSRLLDWADHRRRHRGLDLRVCDLAPAAGRSSDGQQRPSERLSGSHF